MIAAGFQVLNASNATEWRHVLDGTMQFDFTHLPEYHAFAEQQGEGIARLYVFSSGEYRIAIPLLLRSLESVEGLESTGVGWQDATGAFAYAGPVASHPTVPATLLQEFQDGLTSTLRHQRVISLFTRLHPLIPQLDLLNGMGECRQTATTVSIDLRLPPEGQRAAYRKSTKYDVEKLRRQGITCSEIRGQDSLDEFIDLYLETMRRLNARDFFLFRRSYFEHLMSALESNMHLFGCFLDKRMICGGLFGSCNGIVQYHLGGTRNEFLKLAPTKLLIDTVRGWAWERGDRVFHLGGGSNANEVNPLLHFKAGFSDRKHSYSTWRWVILPETYEKLCVEKTRWNARHERSAAVPGYFPEYRCPTIPST